MYIAGNAAHFAMFTVGMLLSDLDVLERNNDLPHIFHVIKTYIGKYLQLSWHLLFLFAMFLGGVPAFIDEMKIIRGSPGWYFLSFLKPEAIEDPKWFYLFWAATFLLITIPRLSWLKSFFETRFCQYLGRISFALYLVHGPVLWILADRIYLAVGWTRTDNLEGLKDWMNLYPISKAGPLGLEPSFLLPHLVILPFTFWLAEIATKLFDEPSVKFSQWAFRTTLAGF